MFPNRLAALALLTLLSACATMPQPAPASAADAAAVVSSATADTGGTARDDVADAAAVLESEPGHAATAVAASPVDVAPVAEASAVDVHAVAAASDEAAQPTQAELDYAAIYGDPVYNPIADPTLPSPAEVPVSYDPWEAFNRSMHRVNQLIDRRIARPLAEAYMNAVPRPVRLGVGNFFRNLGQPVAALNSLLQGKPKQAGQALARFALNSTLGIAGILDPASDLDIPLKSEDFGQTLGVWGWERSRYVELPLFGPRTVRDVFGLIGDAPLSPIRGIEQDKTRIFLQGLQLVDVRTQLLALDSLLEGAPDEYALLRDAWLQRRNYQIQGDRLDGEESLPDYLREEYNPTVPVDAMPIMPTDGG